MKYLVTALLLLLSQFGYSQIILKLKLVYKNEVGHSVEMYYLIDSLEKTTNAVSVIKKVNEGNLLSSIGLPLEETGHLESQCDGKDTLNLVYNDFLSKKHTQKFLIKGSSFNLKLSLVKVSTDFCIYNLYYNHWGSYDVNFKQAAVLTSRPKITKFSKRELKQINVLEEHLGSLLVRDAS